ncbi:MAG TPA: ATP-binding protein [Candidatus Norongarragalinales archaeon]|jgi:ATP-dependent Lon protease|nr:ATP-binding protein [Candidatus Norongarragalinales archaeon]
MPQSAAAAVASLESFEQTSQISIPKDLFQQVIGQEEAVHISKICAMQRRNLLLVGPPGTGKSMIASAISTHLPKPNQEVSILHNPENPERPVVEVKTRVQIEKEQNVMKQLQGKLVEPTEVEEMVAEKLGFRCRRCGKMSSAKETFCPECGTDKFTRSTAGYNDLLNNILDEQKRSKRMTTTIPTDDGREEIIVYERSGEKIRVFNQKLLEKMDELKKRQPRKIIVPMERKNFIVATGASETELLGDVRHDPYGGHAQVGTQPYLRVVPGAIHEAHEGVLFIDELSTLNYIQRYLLTAMQERRYAIVGKNPQSAGASVRVEDVPADFVMVAASNINDLPGILPPLRSRIIGNGYEVLLDTFMPDTRENRFKLSQFIAQEITKDKKIPHATHTAVNAIIEEGRRRALKYDDAENSLTLRLRELGGIVRLAGDIAVGEDAEFIDKTHVARAITRGISAEEQLQQRYGSLWKASQSDNTNTKDSKVKQKEIQ